MIGPKEDSVGQAMENQMLVVAGSGTVFGDVVVQLAWGTERKK